MFQHGSSHAQDILPATSWTGAQQGYATKLEATASNEFLYPSDELLAATSKYRELTTDQEAEDWNEIFVLGVIEA